MVKKIKVVGAVILRDGRILCAQRSRSANLPGLWEFPGGKVEAGETAVDALEREIREELLAEVRVGSLIETTVHNYSFAEVTLSTFYCELLSPSVSLTEHESLAWLSPAELPTLDWAPADLPTVLHVSKGFPRPYRFTSCVEEQP